MSLFAFFFTCLGVTLFIFLLLAPITPSLVLFFVRDPDLKNRYTATLLYLMLVGIWLCVGLLVPDSHAPYRRAKHSTPVEETISWEK